MYRSQNHGRTIFEPLYFHESSISCNFRSFREISNASYPLGNNHRFNILKVGSCSYSTGKGHDVSLQKLGIMKARITSLEPRFFNRRRKRSREGNGSKSLYPSPTSTLFPVKAIHASQTIDLVNVYSKVFGANNTIATSAKHNFGKNSLIVQLNPTTAAYHTNNNDSGKINSAHRFVAIYRFGSIVFFNLSPRDIRKLKEAIKKYGTGAISAGFERDEHFEVAVEPNLKWGLDSHVVNGDYCVVPTLDMNSTAVISNIMAQSVALDSYSDIVDELLADFANVNSSVTRTGNFTHMEKEKLFRIVSQNNSVFIDMVSKIGVKDRSDTAWNLSQYEQVHEGLRDEFEIESRFDHIEFKLDLIQQNAKFFLEVLHSQKSNSLEWCILILILFECVLMIMEMSGFGEIFFGGISQSIFSSR